MEILNNCDELLALLTHDRFHCGSHEYSCGGYLIFQENECEIGGLGGGCEGTFFMSPKYPMFIFEITAEDEYFTLSVFRGPSFILDQTLGIKLPNYILGELIATIQNY